MLSFFGMIMWFYYHLFFPFDVLVVDDITNYKPRGLDQVGYLTVIEQPFVIEQPTQKGGETARFTVKFIYNFGNPPEVVGLLKCSDDSIYEVKKMGETPKLIGKPGVLNIGVSDYNMVSSRAKGKTCHFEFDAEWQLFLQTIHKKMITTDFLVE